MLKMRLKYVIRSYPLREVILCYPLYLYFSVLSSKKFWNSTSRQTLITSEIWRSNTRILISFILNALLSVFYLFVFVGLYYH